MPVVSTATKVLTIVFDVDLTLLDTPVFRPGNDPAAWEEQVFKYTYPPVNGAVAGVERMLRDHHGAVHLLTARSSRLEVVTRANLREHFPALAGSELSMGYEGVSSGGFEYKMQRLAGIIGRASGPIAVVDDDERVRRWVRGVDDFYHAPWCW